jgi:hypothetical protein
MANAMKYHKLVVVVEDDRGECFSSANGTWTPASASVLARIALQFCMRSTGFSFDKVMELLAEDLEQNGRPFEDSEIFSGSSIN